jgi:hypothetical protein
MKQIPFFLVLCSLGLAACQVVLAKSAPTPTWLPPQLKTQTPTATATSGWFATVLPITPTATITPTVVPTNTVNLTASKTVFLPIIIQGVSQ